LGDVADAAVACTAGGRWITTDAAVAAGDHRPNRDRATRPNSDDERRGMGISGLQSPEMIPMSNGEHNPRPDTAQAA
jgi:hypothetical protein